jgi:hypothetical protein
MHATSVRLLKSYVTDIYYIKGSILKNLLSADISLNPIIYVIKYIKGATIKLTLDA